MENIDLTFAFMLTTLAGLSTGIGSIIAYFIRKPKYSYLAVLLGFSAGVMIYISFAELLKGSIDKIGFKTANIYFFIAIAIAIHNIPEGISVSVPIFYATGSRRKAFFYSFGSGLAEPIGALIGYAILLPFLSQSLISGLLALVAGIMVYISLDELLPLAHRYGGEHLALGGLLSGMAVMAISLWMLY